MRLTISPWRYLNNKCSKVDWGRFSSFWDIASQSQKSEGAFIQAGAFIWQNMVYTYPELIEWDLMSIKPLRITDIQDACVIGYTLHLCIVTCPTPEAHDIRWTFMKVSYSFWKNNNTCIQDWLLIPQVAFTGPYIWKVSHYLQWGRIHGNDLLTWSYQIK